MRGTRRPLGSGSFFPSAHPRIWRRTQTLNPPGARRQSGQLRPRRAATLSTGRGRAPQARWPPAAAHPYPTQGPRCVSALLSSQEMAIARLNFGSSESHSGIHTPDRAAFDRSHMRDRLDVRRTPCALTRLRASSAKEWQPDRTVRPNASLLGCVPREDSFRPETPKCTLAGRPQRTTAILPLRADRVRVRVRVRLLFAAGDGDVELDFALVPRAGARGRGGRSVASARGVR